MKQIFYTFVLFFSPFLLGQVAITEVYYDTPVSEMLSHSEYAHAGEFIELFNYSKEDFDISGWILSDNESSITIPQNTMIKSGSFLIFRKPIQKYDENNTDGVDYFFKMFDEIQNPQNYYNQILSDKYFLLNNYDEGITLKTRKLNGKYLDKYYTISSVYWDCKEIIGRNSQCDKYHYEGALNSEGINFDRNYYVKSFQRTEGDMQQIYHQITSDQEFKRATPFKLGYNFELLDIDEIQQYKELQYNNYCSVVDWSGSVNNILNSNCNNYVPLISESFIQTNILSTKCFNFDEAGNQITNYDCSFSDTGNNSESEIIEESEVIRENELKNHFYLAPNPTDDVTILSWDKEVADLVSEIIIVPINGAFEIPIQSSSVVNNSISISLSSYSGGLYVVKFYLTTGEHVTKYLMKH